MSPDPAPRPAESRLEAPPQPDAGRIINVEHDHVNTRFRRGGTTECHHCGAPVNRTEPHTTAFIRFETAIGPQYKRPAFCGPECWRAFATAD